MEKYLVVTRVAGKDYLVDVEATSNYKAEHEILDRGICGKHSYGVEGAQAFSGNELNTDTFRSMALTSKTISMTELIEIINKNNDNILTRDLKEALIEDAKKKIKELQKLIKEAEETILAIDIDSNLQ